MQKGLGIAGAFFIFMGDVDFAVDVTKLFTSRQFLRYIGPALPVESRYDRLRQRISRC